MNPKINPIFLTQRGPVSVLFYIYLDFTKPVTCTFTTPFHLCLTFPSTPCGR